MKENSITPPHQQCTVTKSIHLNVMSYMQHKHTYPTTSKDISNTRLGATDSIGTT